MESLGRASGPIKDGDGSFPRRGIAGVERNRIARGRCADSSTLCVAPAVEEIRFVA